MLEHNSYHAVGRTASDIAADVENAVRSGRLSAPTRLTSIRGLAADLGISPSTVHAAYRQLARRGVVVSDGARGMRVSARSTVSARPALVVPADVRDLGNGNPDVDLLPPLEWALDTPLPSPYLYGADTINDELCALAAAELRTQGIDARAQMVVSGALDGIDRLLTATLRAGDRVLVEDPTYAELLDLLRAIDLVPVGVPIDDEGPLPQPFADALHGVRAAIITPRAHNPTGARITPPRAEDLRQAIASHAGVLVIENDNSALITGGPYTAVAPASDHWAIIQSVSKALGPDLRIAVATGDPATIAAAEGRQLLGPGWVSHILQETTLRLWRDPRTTALLSRAKSTYTTRRQTLIDALASHGIEARGASGVNVYVPVSHESAAAQRLLLDGWAVRTGEGYRVASGGPFVRITTATLQPEVAAPLAEDIANAAFPPRSPIPRAAQKTSRQSKANHH